jgi:putative transposase
MEWFEVSCQRACGLLVLQRSSFYYRSRKKEHVALKMRLKELAMVRVRFGYPRLTVLLRREGWAAGKKLVYRLYRELGLEMRSKKRRKLASANRGLVESATQPNQRWSMDFMTDRLEGGRYFRTLTVIDQFTRECLKLEVAHHMSGIRVVESLEQVAELRGYPKSITVDNGTEFCSRTVDAWAYRNQVKLDFIRPGRPVENGLIESFNGCGMNALTCISSGQWKMHTLSSPFGERIITLNARTALLQTCLRLRLRRVLCGEKNNPKIESSYWSKTKPSGCPENGTTSCSSFRRRTIFMSCPLFGGQATRSYNQRQYSRGPLEYTQDYARTLLSPRYATLHEILQTERRCA